MCSLDRIYAMLVLECRKQTGRSEIPVHRSHDAFARGRPDLAPAKSRALLRGAVLPAVAASALRTARFDRECRNHSLTS